MCTRRDKVVKSKCPESGISPYRRRSRAANNIYDAEWKLSKDDLSQEEFLWGFQLMRPALVLKKSKKKKPRTRATIATLIKKTEQRDTVTLVDMKTTLMKRPRPYSESNIKEYEEMRSKEHVAVDNQCSLTDSCGPRTVADISKSNKEIQCNAEEKELNQKDKSSDLEIVQAVPIAGRSDYEDKKEDAVIVTEDDVIVIDDDDDNEQPQKLGEPKNSANKDTMQNVPIPVIDFINKPTLKSRRISKESKEAKADTVQEYPNKEADMAVKKKVTNRRNIIKNKKPANLSTLIGRSQAEDATKDQSSKISIYSIMSAFRDIEVIPLNLSKRRRRSKRSSYNSQPVCEIRPIIKPLPVAESHPFPQKVRPALIHSTVANLRQQEFIQKALMKEAERKQLRDKLMMNCFDTHFSYARMLMDLASVKFRNCMQTWNPQQHQPPPKSHND